MAGTPVQTLRIEVVLNPAASSREHIVNVWHIATVGATTPATASSAFYTDLNAFYQAIDGLFAAEMEGVVPSYRAFNLLENKPRQPIEDVTMTALDANTGRDVRENCICLSYRALYESGVSPKRRRGRIYLGPWTGGMADATTGKLASSFRTNVVNAAQTLINAHQASSLYSWVVYSPTSDPAGTGETGAHEVIAAWVDDEIDTQRRRGLPQPGVKYIVT